MKKLPKVYKGYTIYYDRSFNRWVAEKEQEGKCPVRVVLGTKEQAFFCIEFDKEQPDSEYNVFNASHI